MIRTIAIDDEPLALQQLTSYIEKVPFLKLVAECRSAMEAMEVLNNEEVDAIFCDINMPDINGMKGTTEVTCSRLRRLMLTVRS